MSGFFSHVDPTEPLSIVMGENSAMLSTPLNESSKAAASMCTPIRAMTGDEPSLFTDDPCSSASLNTHISRPSSLSCTPTSPASNVCSTKSPQCTPPTSSTCKRPATATTSPKTPTVGGGDTVTSVPGTSSKCGESKILASKSENYVSKHLTPITPLTTKSNSTRTGSARILTSSECLAILEEQRLKKIQEAEEKEKRKLEREKKRKEKEEEMKRKKEEEERLKQRKAASSKAVAKKKVTTTKNSAKKTTSTGSAGHTAPSTSSAPKETHTSVKEPARKKRKVAKDDDTSEETDDWVCSFCFGNYGDDQGNEWIRCGCLRWVHEECVEDVIVDAGGTERFCPYCTSLIG